jgi:hypothetical protein
MSMNMEEIKTGIAVCAFLLSALALIFTRRSWFESNRPIVTAEIVTHSGGNVAILYNLVIHNTGNRPATEIKLQAKSADIEKAINQNTNAALQKEVRRCFSLNGKIPLLHQQSKVSNGFGLTSIKPEENVLVYEAIIPITIKYKDLNGRKYVSKQTLIVKDSEFFAGSGWDKAV